MDLRKLRHVVVLAEERHFGRAADRLGVTQSALTRSIQATEAELDLRLFDRGREGVHLTRAGAVLLDDARLVLGQMDMLERDMALLSKGTIGEVHCGFGPMVAALILADALGKIARDHPALRIRTSLGDVAELQALLLEGELDFAVLALPLVESRTELSFKRLGQVRLAPVVRRGHPLAGRRVEEADIAGFPIIGGTGHGQSYATTLTCDNFEIAKDVTLASDAIWITAAQLADDRFAVLEGLAISQAVELAVASLARRTLSPPARLLIEQVGAALRTRSAPANAGRERRTRTRRSGDMS